MHPTDRVTAAFALDFAGLNPTEISRLIDVPRRTVAIWLSQGELEEVASTPMRAAAVACGPQGCPLVARQSPEIYAYLLGLYLGDGCLSLGRRDVYKLRIVQDKRYTELIKLCADSIPVVCPCKVGFVPREGCVEICGHSKHWPCLFPQHGPGRKHDRTIALAEWQRDLVSGAPFAFLRGLIHSDGCRVTNRVVVRGKAYDYPRYFFSNRSADIRRLFATTCEAVGITARTSGWELSVARRADVALLDANGCEKR
jgi:hypothetical protein